MPESLVASGFRRFRPPPERVESGSIVAVPAAPARAGGRPLLPFDVLPDPRLLRAVLDLRVTEHVRMAALELGADVRRHGLEVEQPGLLRHSRVEHHLEQKVAELAFELVERFAL